MNAVFLIVGMLGASPVSETVKESATLEEPAPASSQSGGDRRLRSLPELRKAYLSALKQSSSQGRPDDEHVVPELVALYHEIGTAEGLSRERKSRMRRAIALRLNEIRIRLADASSRRSGQTAAHAPAPGRDRRNAKADSLSGPADVARAAKLIDLIQTTIAPDTWDVNGGRGRARYFDPVQALVIRQTEDVHHQIGGTLGAVRGH